MADIEKFMTVSAGDIEKIMGVAVGDIEAVMGFGVVTGPAWAGVTGVQFGGPATTSNQIQWKTIQSSGNTADFGNLALARTKGAGATSNTTRAIFHDGQTASSTSAGVMDYITVGSAGDAGDFGDIIGNSEGMSGGAMSNGTLAFMGLGFDSNGTYRDPDLSYVTIASTGNSTDAGDDLTGRNFCGTNSGDTRGLIWSGYD